MEKKRYYVSMHTGAHTWEIREGEGQSTYDFAIDANDLEVSQVKDLFYKAHLADFRTYGHSHLHPLYDIYDEDHQEYDHTLSQIYDWLHRLGTPETRENIEQLGIRDALKGHAGNNVHNPDVLRGTYYTPPGYKEQQADEQQ